MIIYIKKCLRTGISKSLDINVRHLRDGKDKGKGNSIVSSLIIIIIINNIKGGVNVKLFLISLEIRLSYLITSISYMITWIQGGSRMSAFDEKRSKRELREIEDINSGDRIFAVFPVKKNFINLEYFCMFQNASELLATDEHLTGNDYRILFLLFSFLDMKNYISLNHSVISEKLNMKKSNVSRSIATLIDRGIIIKGPRVGKGFTYILNSKYGYKGHLKDINNTRKKHLQLVEEQETEKEISNKQIEEKLNSKKKLVKNEI